MMNFSLGVHPQTGLAHLTIIREMLDPKAAAREEYHDLLAAALCYDAHAIRLDAESKRISRLAVQAREQAANLKEMANL